MRKILIIGAVMLLGLTSCNEQKQVVTEGVTKEQISFPIGERIDNPSFTGEAYLKPLISVDSVFNFPQTNVVTFGPAAHSSWHRHGGMVVLVTDGVGLYQEEGKPAQILRRGDVLQIPAGVRHWHGATKDNWFSQVVIYDSAWKPSETYNDSNGPIRLANTVDAPNVAGAPGLHYVVFEPGVINAWHTHPGGQILIATDGIGYHQIEGQPVEVLHPGDVVMCPPNVKHWHGAAANSRFAHLAVGTNPDRPAVVWSDEMLSKEEYERLPKE